jgi:capsular exopolysaccharide synthesis family protein
MGLLGGLLGGVALAYVLESLDDTITTSAQVEATSLLSLAAVPFAPMKQRKTLPPGMSPDLFTLSCPQSSVAEAYRKLRSALLLFDSDHPPRVVVVTSGFPGEGKTTTSANCAIALAQQGSRVLLVDADLRRSQMHLKFELSEGTGLSTLLAGTSGPESISNPVPDLPNLSVLPAGPTPPAPAEMLASKRMQELLDTWANNYDFVIIDTSPMFPFTDALPLAARADAVLVVARAGTSRKMALLRTGDALDRVNAKIAGVVLNGVDLKLEHYYYGPHRYSYKNGCYEAYYSEKQQKH